MTKVQPTLMAVHAHPDDEVLSTGGILLRYAQAGVRTVLVTCTNGELGDAPAGIKPDTPGHDEGQVRAIRRRELLESCRILKVARLEMLGYLDSGMQGWAQNGRPGSLSGVAIEEEVERLAVLLREEHPQVLVTYDESGGYGHPDHVRAHQIAVAAAALTGIPEKVYYTAIPRSAVAQAARQMQEMGVNLEDLRDAVDPDNPPFGTDDTLVTTVVDVAAEVDSKLAALKAHASQGDNGFLLRFPPELVREFLSREYFVRAVDRTGAPLPESDLFAGVS